jgi:hypothetical protein
VDLDEVIQDIIQQDDGGDYSQLYETMFQFLRSPININTATSEELKSLYLLSELEIQSILEYREKYGDFISIYELQAVPNLDMRSIHTLLLFADISERSMNVGNDPFLKRLLSEENNTLIYRTEAAMQDESGFYPIDENGNSASRNTVDKLLNRNPYDTAKYLGGALRHLIRFRTSHKNDFRLGFNIKKDAGEQFIWDRDTKRYGFDFYSFHFVKYNVGRLKALAIGDYQLQFGQGLIMAGGFAPPKSAEAVSTMRRSNSGVRPYTSTVENSFLRGISATVEVTKKIDVTLFGSKNKLDGTVLDSSDFDADEIQAAIDEGIDLNLVGISSLSGSGLHRTANELDKKRIVGQTILGGNASYISKNKNLKGGFTFVNTAYDAEFERSDQVYNNTDFSGNKNSTYGLNYSYNWQNFIFFGEMARSSSGGTGMVHGFSAYLSQKVEYGMLFRHFTPDFHSFYSNAFSENSRNINETGIYWGLKIKLNRKWTWAGYYDMFKFPWLKFRVDAPSEGSEFLTQVNYKMSRKIKAFVRYKYETKERSVSSSFYDDLSDEQLEMYEDDLSNILPVLPYDKQQYVYNLDVKTSKQVSLKTRIQHSSFDFYGITTRGYYIAQSVDYKTRKWQLSYTYSLFDTEGSDNRQYVFEKEVLYGYPLRSFSGRGTRSVFLTRYKMSKKVTFWLKIGTTFFSYIPGYSINATNGTIDGNVRTDVRFQVQFKL